MGQISSWSYKARQLALPQLTQSLGLCVRNDAARIAGQPLIYHMRYKTALQPQQA